MHIQWYYYLLAALVAVLGSVRKKTWRGIMLGYFFLILASTVVSRAPRDYFEYDFRLFKFIFVDSSFMQQVLANVIMFIPLGFLLAKEFSHSVILACILSITIEMLQIIFRRGVLEIDDIISNTMGALIGTILFKALLWINDKRRIKRRGIFEKM